ncbi:MAG: sugar ABC transporter substrate-binding protein [Acetobacteraceae bacterium]|nr:sugar ABC transporter substrate-binding protein [Acetobacteraceae bacterium]
MPGMLSRRTLLGSAAAATLARPALAAPVTLDFWDMISGPPEYIETGRRLVEEFNTEHPDIQVRYRSIPWTNWYQTFVTAIGAGKAPDLSTGAGYQAVQLYDQGAIRPIDDVIAELRASGELDTFYPGTVDRLRYDNHYVALPWAMDIRVWLYRRDIVEPAGVAPPTNWAELRDAAKRLTGGGKYGLVGSGDTGGSHYLFALMLNNGGGLFDAQRKLVFQSPRNVEALQYLADLVRDGSVNPASAGYDSDTRRRSFIQGEAAFILDGPGFADSAPPDVKAKIGVLPPLAGPHGDKGSIEWVNNIMVYDQTKQYEATKLFLKWWSAHELVMFTQGHARTLSARRTFLADPYFAADPVRSTIIANYLPIGKSTGYAAPGIFPQLNAVEGEGAMFTLVQQILQGKDVRSSMTQAEPKLQQLLG